ncbi:tail tube protein [Nostoc phage A1]|uniref:Tail tube protein n=1 Tax=Nostoc phage A1 TaxID=1775256 RepID=A0ACD6B8W2_9CAUD|nr:tail tube protein [Nostoc phage A1]
MAVSKRPFSINSFAVNLNIGNFVDARYWSKCSKIEKTYNTGEYSDGQSNIIYTLPGAIKYPEVVLSKAFSPGDEELINRLIAVNSDPIAWVTVFIQPMYRDGYYNVPQGGKIILEFCTVARATPINEIDTIGSNAAMFECALNPSRIRSDGGNINWWSEPAAQVAEF